MLNGTHKLPVFSIDCSLSTNIVQLLVDNERISNGRVEDDHRVYEVGGLAIVPHIIQPSIYTTISIATEIHSSIKSTNFFPM